MTYRFLSPAQRDLASALACYEKASPGWGMAFLEGLKIPSIGFCSSPRQGPVSRPGTAVVRRCRMRRFPYGVIYSIEGEVVLIAAVFKLHQHPDSWRDRT